jgi:hypothetical protein
MAPRALIIAIQDYPKVEVGGMAKSLPGTLQPGVEFKAWLAEKWKAEGVANPQLIFCSEPVQADGHGATSDDIREALLELKTKGQSATEELYVFFSGHGFSFEEKLGSRADILVTSDFRKAALSGQCCLKLDEIIYWLRIHLGPGRHYYFIDSCRNPLGPNEIQPAPLLPINAQASGEASTFLLQSTVEGATAAVGDAFPSALLSGLRGRGKAKTWDTEVDDAMFVRYDSLRRYMTSKRAVDQQITSRADGTEGESEAVISVLRPVPLSSCTIEISNAPASLKGDVLYRRGRAKVPERHALNGNSTVLQLEPDTYLVTVQVQGEAAVEPGEPVRLDLYEDQTAVFSTSHLEAAAAPVDLQAAANATSADVDFVVPHQTALTVRNVLTGETLEVDQSRRARLPPGRYFATFGSATDRKMVRREIDIEPGASVSVNLAEWRESRPHVSIANQLPSYAVHADGLDFSESLHGLVTDPDLDLWLAIVGGGRILGSTGDFSKLAQFPLHDFADEPIGASPIYLLAGFEKVDSKLDIALSRGADVRWSAPTEPAGMTGIREAYFSAVPGSWLFSLRVGDQPAYTVATFAMANRAMLVTLTLDDDDRPRVSQYLLPLGHLVGQMPGFVQERLQHGQYLRDLRFIAQAGRAFRKRRDLWKEFGGAELDDLLYAKWLDPIGSSLAAYEKIRRGQGDRLDQVVRNMKKYFAGLPDTAALTKLAGKRALRPNGTPLFIDGLRAFPDYAKLLPLPASHLDFSGIWTAWRAAVGNGT